MSKYFKGQVISIGEYRERVAEKNKIKNDDIIKNARINIEKQKIISSKIEEIFGDVLVSNDVIRTLCLLFNLEDIYDESFNERLIKAFHLVMMYPTLKIEAIKDLMYFYDGMLFEENNLFSELDKAVQSKKDDAFDKFMSKVVVTKINSDRSWKKEASILNLYIKDYGVEYIDYLKEKVINEHINASSIIVSLPLPALIKTDEELVKKINEVYGTDKIPFSYQLNMLIMKI